METSPATPMRSKLAPVLGVIGLLGSLLAVLSFLLLIFVMLPVWFRYVPQGLRGILSGPMLLVLAGASMALSAASGLCSYLKGKEGLQAIGGIVSAIALGLLGLCLFIAAVVFRNVFVIMRLDAVPVLFSGVLPVQLGLLACIGCGLTSIAAGIAAGNGTACRVMALISAAGFAFAFVFFCVALFFPFYQMLGKFLPLGIALVPFALSALLTSPRQGSR